MAHFVLAANCFLAYEPRASTSDLSEVELSPAQLVGCFQVHEGPSQNNLREVFLRIGLDAQGNKIQISRADRLEFARLILQSPADLETRRELFTELRRATGRGPMSYQLALQSLFLDELLGISKTELEIDEAVARQSSQNRSSSHEILGIGSPHDFWFSNYAIIDRVIDFTKRAQIKSVVDLGSGTGRLGIALGFLTEETRFIGLEIDPGRSSAAAAASYRWEFGKRILFIEQDLLDSNKPLPDSDFYFVYGPTNVDSINQKVLNRLEEKARSGLKFFIASHNSSTNRLLRQSSWLKPVSEKDPLSPASGADLSHLKFYLTK